jgi:hypothetical protein
VLLRIQTQTPKQADNIRVSREGEDIQNEPFCTRDEDERRSLQHHRDEISFSALWRRRLRSGYESENGARIISSVSSQIGWFVVLVRLRLLVFGADSRSGGPA